MGLWKIYISYVFDEKRYRTYLFKDFIVTLNSITHKIFISMSTHFEDQSFDI